MRQRAGKWAFGMVGTAVRVVLVFLLAFGTVSAGQRAFAESPPSAPSPGPSALSPASSSTSSGESSSSASQHYIMDIGVFLNGTTADAFAYATNTKATRAASIEQKAGRIDFDAGIEWNDEKWEYESDKVSWQLDPGDDAIAHITPTGVLEARGTDDGIVHVTASVSGDYTADGKPLSARFAVTLAGQTDTAYVTCIVICDDAGAPIDPSYRFEEGTLATAMLELQATVTVFDPVLGSEVAYQVTPASGLAAQTGGEVSDLLWESADDRLGTVSEQGIYRPALEGTNRVIAYSTAGFNGNRIEAVATIEMPGEESGDYHPQSTLTVKAYYENYPDEEVASKTYSVDDLEALGTTTATYTALRGATGFFTTTGRGPLLTKVLKDAGIDVDGIARLRFGTPDNYQGVVSWSMLVEADRYYFPSIDTNSYAGKVQVSPMIAIESHRNAGTDTAAHYDMDDQRRFLLLFGAKDTGETTTNLQVYNIHTLFVELEGSPPVKPGSDGDGDADGDDKTKRDGKKNDKGGAKDRDDAPAAAAQDDPSGGGGGGQNMTASDGGGGAGDIDRARSAGAGGGSGDGASQARKSLVELPADSVVAMTSGKWSMLQAVSRYKSNVSDLAFDNPLAPFTAPACAGLFAAGGLEAFLRFRWQKRVPR